MEAIIKGTGKTGCMLNEITLDVFDALAIRYLVKKAIEEDNNEKYHSYDREKWQEFIRVFNEAFTEPNKLEDAIL